jgi:DNA mismatch repair protein MutL
VARVTLKTRVSSEELGTEISLEGSTFTGQKAIQCPVGSSFSVSHLFYNVPARRNFLKSNAVECRHAINEFLRIALAYPKRSFTLIHNDIEVYKMKGGSENERLMAVFGNDTPDQVVSFSEETPYFNLRGFVGKAEYARKSRGDQYFFVNNRFIRDNYLNHAVISAFGDRLSSDTFPLYVIFIEIDPSRVDINIHPTKTEIKFLDDKNVYAILRATVKRALGKFSVMPSLDFEQEPSFIVPIDKMNSIPVQPTIKVNPNYNPFKTETNDGSSNRFRTQWNNVEPARTQEWLKAHEDLKKQNPAVQQQFENTSTEKSLSDLLEDLDDFRFVQVSLKHFTASSENCLLVIDIMGAYERINY